MVAIPVLAVALLALPPDKIFQHAIASSLSNPNPKAGSTTR